MQLVTGATMHVPAGLITKDNIRFDLDYVKQLSECITSLQQSRWESFSNTTETENIPKSLSNCSHIWVRVDRVRRPLEAPYSGPFPILQRFEKTFLIDVNGKSDAISIERLKPAKFLSKKPSVHQHSVTPSATASEKHAETTSPQPSNAASCLPRRSQRSRKKTVRFDL